MNIHKVVYFGFAVAQAVPPLVLFSLMRTHHNMPISGSIITTAGVFLALDPLIDFFAAPVSLDSENATAEQKKKIRTRMRNFLGGLAATMGSVLGALLFVNYM